MILESKKRIRRKPKQLPSKSELEHLYVKERKTLQEIGKIYHVNLQKIRKLLVGYGIKIASRGGQKGHITTPKTRRRIGASNKIRQKRFWKTLTENEKAERITRHGFFKKGQVSPMKGKKASITTRKKQSRSATIRFQTQKHPHQGTHRSEKTKRLLREARLRQKPTKDETWPEKFAAKMLKKEKITFEKQKSFRNPPCIVDLYIEPKICIFLDGDYWHCNPNDYVYKKKLNPGFKPNDQRSGKKYAKDVWAKDKKITRELRKKGYSILRFWQSELETEPEKCLQKIIKA
jgi:DNA mismatch endonuclease (patch repair protein)